VGAAADGALTLHEAVRDMFGSERARSTSRIRRRGTAPGIGLLRRRFDEAK
jgi:hypothetical protein